MGTKGVLDRTVNRVQLDLSNSHDKDLQLRQGLEQIVLSKEKIVIVDSVAPWHSSGQDRGAGAGFY